MKFKVEATFIVDGEPCVAARCAGGDFSVSSSSRLDGVPLLQHLELARILQRPALGQNMNLFVFVLGDLTALARFQKYDVVELSP